MHDETDWYICGPHPDHPGWLRWQFKDTTRFNGVFGDVRFRRDGDRAVVRIDTSHRLTNIVGVVHGGALMSFIDCSMFIGCYALGRTGAMKGLTVELSTQFLGVADAVRPIDAIVEISRETGRMVFMRGTVEQAGDAVSSFMGIMRKSGA